MTCIAAIVDPKLGVYMGADSASCSGWDLSLRADLKVFENGGMLFGCTSSWRMIDLLRYKLHLPDHDPRLSNHKFIATAVVDAIRTAFREGGYLKKEHDVESGGTFLVAYKGELFCVDSDFQVEMPLDPFAACGCGWQVARGALYALSGVSSRYYLEPENQLRLALEAAERLSAGVRGPFHILHQAKPSTEVTGAAPLPENQPFKKGG